MVHINGVAYAGSISNVSITNGQVFINNVQQDQKVSGVVRVEVIGNATSVSSDASVTVSDNVEGNASAGGSVTVKGDVGGNASAGGSVNCGKVAGRVTAGGSVNIG